MMPAPGRSHYLGYSVGGRVGYSLGLQRWNVWAQWSSAAAATVHNRARSNQACVGFVDTMSFRGSRRFLASGPAG